MMLNIHGGIVSAQDIQPQNDVFCDFEEEYPSRQWALPQDKIYEVFLQDDFT
jgi:hypothetical protein